MSTASSQVSRQDPERSQPRTGDRRIHPAVSVFIIAVILVGFAKNFYLRAWLGTRPLILSAWLHGVIMSAWLLLFAIQVVLLARNRVDLHRRLGPLGIVLGTLILVAGVLTIVIRAQIAFPEASLAKYTIVFVAFDGLSLLLFSVLVACALLLRARPTAHRRLMSMAMVALLPPAFGRLVAYVVHEHVELIVLGLMVSTALICVAIDTLRSGRVRGASLVPGVLIGLVNVVTYFAQIAT